MDPIAYEQLARPEFLHPIREISDAIVRTEKLYCSSSRSSPESSAYSRRTEASIKYDLRVDMVEKAMQQFSHVSVIKRSQKTYVRIYGETRMIVVVLKKLDNEGRSSRLPSSAVELFESHRATGLFDSCAVTDKSLEQETSIYVGPEYAPSGALLNVRISVPSPRSRTKTKSGVTYSLTIGELETIGRKGSLAVRENGQLPIVTQPDSSSVAILPKATNIDLKKHGGARK